jgi:hypothetical protein
MADDNNGGGWNWFLTEKGLLALGAFIVLIFGQITTMIQTFRNGDKAEQAAVNASEAVVRADKVGADVTEVRRVQKNIAMKQGLPVNGPE